MFILIKPSSVSGWEQFKDCPQISQEYISLSYAMTVYQNPTKIDLADDAHYINIYPYGERR